MKAKTIEILKLLLSKWYTKALISLVAFLTTLWVILFSPLGNKAASAMIEHYMTKEHNITLESFKLTHNSYNIVLKNAQISANIDAQYSFFRLKSYGNFKTTLKNNDQTVDGYGNFSISPKIINLSGTLELFDGTAEIGARLRFLKLARAKIAIKDIDYNKMMSFLDIPSNTDTTLSLNIDVKSNKSNSIVLFADLKTSTESFNHTKIYDTDNNKDSSLRELLADSNGNIRAFMIDAVINLDIAHIGILEQFAGLELQGGINSNIKIDGDVEKITINSDTKVANSTISADIDMRFLKLDSIKLDAKNLDISELFYLFSMPSPIDGNLDISARANTDSIATSIDIKRASTNPAILTKHYQIRQPKIDFNAHIDAKTSNNKTLYNLSFASNLSRFEIKNSSSNDKIVQNLLESIR